MSLERDKSFKPDVVFLDYADILKPEQMFKEHRHTLQVLYQTIKGFGDEMGFPVWSATQTNREGSKGENVGIDTISDAYGKAAEVDLLISIGKSDDEKDVKFNPNHVVTVTKPNARVGFLKNRYGADGFFLDCILDTSRVYWEIFDRKQDLDIKENLEDSFGKGKKQSYSQEKENKTDDFEMTRLEKTSEDGISALMENLK